MSSHSRRPIQTSRVGIIGAGISGVAALKQLSHYAPVVFEATGSMGGVWKHCSFNSTKLQTPRCNFEFSDYPWPERDNSNFPTHLEILDYLHGYAKHFDALKHIKFNSKVVEIRHVGRRSVDEITDHDEYGLLLTGNPIWEVAVKTNNTENLQWYAFELLVVCIGKHGDIPRIPVFPENKGEEVFKGRVMHSMEYSKLSPEAANELLKGKKVAVVGYRKSAIDLATECAVANEGPDGEACTMVIRTLHWTVTKYWIWGLPFFLFYSTRSSQFLHQRPNQGLLKSLLCLLSSPLRKVVSKFIESYLVWKLPLVKYGLKPEHPFEEDYASCQMAILPENFFPLADEGKIRFKRTQKWWFWTGGLEFEDKTRLEADLVLLATGFDGEKKLRNVLAEPFSDRIVDSSTGIMPLYRGTINPLIPNMAFIGYIESVSNLHTAELRCRWLSRLADGMFKLPSIEKMREHAGKEIDVMRNASRFYKKQCISTFSIHHSDEICEEMGWKAMRKNNWFLDAFTPYSSRDYAKEN